MTTATKSKTKSAAADMLQRRYDLASSENAAREQMLTQIVEDHGDGEFTAATLRLTQGHMIVFDDMGCKNIFEIMRRLGEHRSTLHLRAEAGDPQKLKDAQQALEDAKRAEVNTQAELSDLENIHDDAGPALMRQIRNMETRMGNLTTARAAAQSVVDTLQHKRKQLRERAPKWLKDSIGRDVLAVGHANAGKLRLGEVKRHVRYLEQILETWDAANYQDKDAQQYGKPSSKKLVLCGYCEHYLPDAFNAGGGSPSYDVERFGRHVVELRAKTLPALRAEQTTLAAEWQQIVSDIEAPLDRWVETGEFE